MIVVIVAATAAARKHITAYLNHVCVYLLYKCGGVYGICQQGVWVIVSKEAAKKPMNHSNKPVNIYTTHIHDVNGIPKTACCSPPSIFNFNIRFCVFVCACARTLNVSKMKKVFYGIPQSLHCQLVVITPHIILAEWKWIDGRKYTYAQHTHTHTHAVV